MGGKPLGQLEIDEHAAEAGIVTRLEAFVDTIKGFACSAGQHKIPHEYIYRGSSALINMKKTFLIPNMAPHAELLSPLMESYGIRAIVLPEPNRSNLLYADRVTSGVECLPFRVTLGDFLRFYHDNGTDLRNVEAFMAGAYGPCRLGKYALEQGRILKDLSINMPIRSSVSNNAYRDINIGPGFMRIAWRATVSMDYLQKLLWRTRPYEKQTGSADVMFEEYKGE
ncbi:unnamed protein product, partial [marine sediment metagenome]